MSEKIGFGKRIRDDSGFVCRGFGGDKDSFKKIVEY